MKLLFPCLLVVVSMVCWTGARQVHFARARISNPQEARVEDPDNFITQTTPSSQVQCYGLARQTRTRTVQIPVLYNRYTGQSSRIPSYIFSLDGGAIDRLEIQGWEVRVQSVSVPEPVYQRVPVCCPWDADCHHGQTKTTTSRPSVSRGPCANGGEVVFRHGAQVCNCPPGFHGAWCHIPDLIHRTQTINHMPAGQSIPYGVQGTNQNNYANAMMQELIKQAQLWKQKMAKDSGLMTSMANPYGPSPMALQRNMAGPFHHGGSNLSPMLSPNDHVLNAINRQWATRPNLTPRQALKIKMAMLVDWYIKQHGQMMRGQFPNMMRSQQFPVASPGQLPPMMQSSMHGGHGMANPYSVIQGQQAPNPHVVALIHHLRQDPRMGDAYANPYSSMGPYNGHPREPTDMGVNGLKARTPWDLDPFDRHPESKFNGGVSDGRSLRERQLMALAFYKYIQNIQRRSQLNTMNAMRGMPDRPQRPPISRNDMPQLPPTIDSVEPPMPVDPQVLKDAMVQQQPETDFHATDFGNEAQSTANDDTPTLVEDRGVHNMPVKEPMRDEGINEVPPNVGPMNGQFPPQMAGAPPGMPPPPSPEELQKMEACRPVLVPKIDECFAQTGHDLTLQQFMNPEYMETARGVCTDSQSFGQCIMAHDQVCGQSDDVIMVTRKMIDSILQMMGMVCQEIMTGGPHNMPQSGMAGNMPQPRMAGNMPQPGMARNMPQPGMAGNMPLPGIAENTPQSPVPGTPQGMPHPPTMSSSPSMHQEESRPPLVTSNTEPEPAAPTPSSGNRIHSNDHEVKGITSKFGNHVTEDTPKQAASKSEDGHHGKEPVYKGVVLFGFPLWMVLMLSGLLLMLLMVATVLLCLCVKRRRRRQKEAALQTEVTRLPQPLDAKFYTIAVAPPTYPSTVAVKQTDDGLALPPIDMGENSPDTVSVNLKEESEYGDDSSIQKPPISDEDADDESDDKEDTSNKKKKDKKEKK